MRGKKTGFTTIEILTVVAVIGILASLGSLLVFKAVSNGRNKEAETELNMLATGILKLAWDTGRMPNGRMRNNVGSAEVEDLSTESCGLVSISDDSNYDDWQGPYYLESFVDPWGNPYFFDPDYRVNGKMRVVVGSYGPNGVGLNFYDEDDIYILLDD